MQKRKVGVIGAGSIVETNHMPSIKAIEQLELAWVFDKNAERMDLLSKMYGVASLEEASVEKRLEEVDICLIGIPYGARKPYLDMCGRLKKAVVVEKPFAFSEKEHLDQGAAFENNQLCINFQRRFYRSVGLLKNLIGSKIFGELQSIKYVQGNFSLKGGSGYLSSAKMAGGGVIADSAIHALDIILFITKATNIRVENLKTLSNAGIDYDTLFDSTLEIGDKAMAVHCEVSTLRNLKNGLTLFFENACVYCDLSPDGEIYVNDKAGTQKRFSVMGEQVYPYKKGALKVGQAFLFFWQEAIEAFQTQVANDTSASSMVLSSKWLGEIYLQINSK
jgi:predicted dehydrogenase